MNNVILAIFFSFLLPALCFKETKPNFCINCRHFITDNDIGLFGKCALFPLKNKKNGFLINGIQEDEIIDFEYCSVTRKIDSMCGKEGKLHKRKYLKSGAYRKTK
jgi:hypothetical protein